ncbi:hypothetical protein BH11PSE10_BH11PSE10_17080 [soil metagenome]
MKRWLKYGLIGAVGLVALASSAVIVAARLGESRMQRQIDLGELRPITFGAADAAHIERGRYLFRSRGCTECHGANGAGKLVIDDEHSGMRVHAPNITPSPGTAVAGYRDADWNRTIRHGVKPDGRPALIMPSEDYARLTDGDLSALVAFLRQLPPQAGRGAEIRFPLPVKVMVGLGLLSDAASKIDHRLPPPDPVPEAITAEHGAYVANACIGCHGPALAGGKIPGAPPDWPSAAKLNPGPGSAMARYPDAAAFAAMLRSGLRPDGSTVSRVMPFESLKALNDTDVQALFLHLLGRRAEAGG